MAFLRVLFLVITILATDKSVAQDMNSFVLDAVEYLHSNHKGGGYNIGRAFTHDITYGDNGKIRASQASETMCVAAVAEVIVYSLKQYAEKTGETDVFVKLPVKTWTSGNLNSLRANIFMYNMTGSNGTGHTLAEFGLGEELKFSDLKPGDFVNLNRVNGSGHAVVFISYIAANHILSNTYSDTVVGFKYFSAQGKGKSDAGFAYRNAYFGASCPHGALVPRDCGVIRSANRVLLNAGRIWSPSMWRYSEAIANRTARSRSAIEGMLPEGVSKGTVDAALTALLDSELSMSEERAVMLSGETTD